MILYLAAFGIAFLARRRPLTGVRPLPVLVLAVVPLVAWISALRAGLPVPSDVAALVLILIGVGAGLAARHLSSKK
jgi:hypothetical protein